MNIFVTGGLGFIGSNIAEFYSGQGHNVTVFDNLSRFRYFGKDVNTSLNLAFLKTRKNIKFIKGDIKNKKLVNESAKDADVIFHTAAQTGVRSSAMDPYLDFSVNCIGTLNLLEASRINGVKSFVYCSTNKVYGENVNSLNLLESSKRYMFKDVQGITKDFSVDQTPHTPYGCSKLSSDIYVQEYGYLYGIKTGSFRMSCIYGKNQFGIEDQGWVSWFILSTIFDKVIKIYGDGKQVRDILFIEDLIDLFDMFLKSREKIGIYNVGGGFKTAISLIELIDLLKVISGKKINIKYEKWRPSDQKVYISDVTELKRKFGWEPSVMPGEGIKSLYKWTYENKGLFAKFIDKL